MTPLDDFLSHLGPLRWDDLVVGYDFGLLTSLEIQAVAPSSGPASECLRALEGADLLAFEVHLWAACAEATGKTPRPGAVRWSEAQDRWREALLRGALAQETTLAGLAETVERIFDQTGCPDDMLLMFHPAERWSGARAMVEPAAVQRFLDHRVRVRGVEFGAVS